MSDQASSKIVDPRVALLVKALGSTAREAFEERAAIRQFMAGFNQERAEVEALLDVLCAHLSSVQVQALRATDKSGSSRWLLTVNTKTPNPPPAGFSAWQLEEIGLHEVLQLHFKGCAVLLPFC